MHVGNNNYIYAAKRKMSHISRGLNKGILRDQNKIILEIYKDLFPVFRERSKYRLPANLIPHIIFFYFRLHDLIITKSQLLTVSKISFADFNDFIMQFYNYLRRDIEMKIKVKKHKFTFCSADFVVKKFIKQVRLDYYSLITGLLSFGDIKDIPPNKYGAFCLIKK